MKKSIFIFAMGLLAFTSANAKGEKTDNSTTTEAVAAPAESKTQASFVYYVISRDDDNGTYQLSETPAPNCGVGTNSPCKITTTSDQSATLEMSQADVDGGVGVTINSRHNL